MKDQITTAADVRERYAEKTKQALASIARDRRNQTANGEALVEIFCAGQAWTREGTRGFQIVKHAPQALITLGLAILLAIIFTR